MKEIKDIREFEKLFGVNIPVHEHFEYYINTLHKSREFYDLKYLVSEYADLELRIESLGYKSMTSYKLDFAMKSLLERIQRSQAYSRFEAFDYSKTNLVSKDELKNNLGVSLISFDLKQANYNIIKAFQRDFDEPGIYADSHDSYLSKSWEHLCGDLGISYTLSLSKSFRQLVFGNLNPKRIQKTQHVVMMKFVDMLIENGYEQDDIVFLSHDEVVVKNLEGKRFHNFSSDGFEFDVTFMTGINNSNMFVRSQIFELEKIKDSKGFVKIIYEMTNFGIAGEILVVDHKKLWGVPGDKFFMNFKKHILQEEIDDRDLLFVNDGMKAKWVIN